MEQLDLPLNTKDVDAPPVALGDSTNLPQNYDSFASSLWETLTFQRNVNLPFAPANDKALGLSIAMQCAAVKARDIAKAEMYLWRKSGRTYVRVEPGEHWFSRMLARRPNDYHSWAEFWRMVITHYALSQNSYILKMTNRAGTVQSLFPLPPARVQMAISDTGNVFYDIDPRGSFQEGALRTRNPIRVPARDMIHLRGRMYDGATGVSNEKLGNPLFDLMGAINRFQANLFANDGRMPIVFESDTANFGTGDQADKAFTNLKAQLREAVRKMATYGDPILLEAGYKAKIIAQNSREAMTKEAFDQIVLRVCALMEIPPSKIYALDSIKYDNQAELNAQYANDILVPIANDIRDKFKLSLFSPQEWETLSPEFDQMQLLAGDPKTLIDVIDKAMKVSLMTINEGRERLPMGLNPLPEKAGKQRLLATAYALVDPQNEVTQIAAQNQPNNDGQSPAPPKQ